MPLEICSTGRNSVVDVHTSTEDIIEFLDQMNYYVCVKFLSEGRESTRYVAFPRRCKAQHILKVLEEVFARRLVVVFCISDGKVMELRPYTVRYFEMVEEGERCLRCRPLSTAVLTGDALESQPTFQILRSPPLLVGNGNVSGALKLSTSKQNESVNRLYETAVVRKAKMLASMDAAVHPTLPVHRLSSASLQNLTGRLVVKESAKKRQMLRKTEEAVARTIGALPTKKCSPDEIQEIVDKFYTCEIKRQDDKRRQNDEKLFKSHFSGPKLNESGWKEWQLKMGRSSRNDSR